MLKPHPWTPLDAFLIAQAAEEAGIPPGVLNVITGHGEVGDELTSNPMVDMVTFTGSTATGRRIMASAAATVKRRPARARRQERARRARRRRRGLRPLASASAQVLMHCGQGCVIQTRLLLPEHLLDAYKEGVDAMAPMIKIGDPRDPRDRARAADPRAAAGPRRGLRAVRASSRAPSSSCGGKRPDGFDKGFFYEPTVFVGSNDMRIAQEEIFGPVLTVIPYSGKDDDAVRIANDSIYGLGGGVVAASGPRAFNVARQIRAGADDGSGRRRPKPSPTSVRAAARARAGATSPAGIGQTGAFGGYKQSGLGREWGRHGLEDFTEIKNLVWS